MSASLQAVTFPNKAGQTLFGIVHEPPSPRADLAVILLSPGVKSRVAPHRLYVKTAEALCALGIRVLRFDFYGLGDSEGTLSEVYLADLYRAIQLGRYVEDTHAALDWMASTYGTRRVVVAGLCGGALTGLLAGDHPNIAGLLSFGIPVMLDGTAVDKTRNMTVGQLAGIKDKYWKKLLRPSAWLRVLTLKTDFRLLWRAFTAPLAARKQSSGARPASPPPPDDNTNPLFAPALFTFLGRQRPALLLFGGADRLQWEFEEKFRARHADRLASHASLADIQVIQSANHIFSFSEWQEEALKRSVSWMTARFPPASDLRGQVTARRFWKRGMSASASEV
jgi:uncharacterized protein